MEDVDEGQSVSDVVYGTPSPTFNRKMKTGVRNLSRSNMLRQFNSTSSSTEPKDLSIYSIGSSPDISPSLPAQTSRPVARPTLQFRLTPEKVMPDSTSQSVFSFGSPSLSPNLHGNNSPEKYPSYSPNSRIVTNGGVLPLPSESNFALERAKAIRKKKLKDQTSPFKRPGHAQSDFIKSSDLLASARANPIDTGVVKNVYDDNKHSLNKRRNDSISSRHTNNHRISHHVSKIRKARAFGWPSSSESSDEEERERFGTRAKRLKTNQEVNIQHSTNMAVHQSGCGKCLHSVPHSTGTSQATCHNCTKGSSSGIPKSVSSESLKARLMRRREKNEILPHTSSMEKALDNRLNSLQDRLISSPLFKSPHRKSRVSFESPTLSSYATSSVFGGRNSPMEVELPSSFQTGRESPMVVDLTTPESERMVQQIEQMEKDEEIARKLQEELDKEFAMTLAQQQEGGVSAVGGAAGIPNDVFFTPDNPEVQPPPQWATPPQRRRRGGRTTAAPQRNDGNPYFEISNLLENLQSEFGSEMINLGLLHGNHHGGRRRNGGRGFVMVTPDRGGEDYDELLRLGEMMGDAKERGLTKGELNRLPTMIFKKNSDKTDPDTAECSICMCEYENGDKQKILPCFHSFHSQCIDKWIYKNASCPVCRVEIKI